MEGPSHRAASSDDRTDPKELEQRSNIKFCYKLGMNAGSTEKSLRHCYGVDALNYTAVRKWRKRVVEGVEDIYVKGGILHTTKSMVTLNREANQYINKRSNVTLEMLAAELEVPISVVHRILPEISRREIYTKIVPRKLTVEQRQARLEYCNEYTRIRTANPILFSRIIFGWEKYFYPYQEVLTSCVDINGTNISSRIKAKQVKIPMKGKGRILNCFQDTSVVSHKVFSESQTPTSKDYLNVLERVVCTLKEQNKENLCLILPKSPFYDSIYVREFLAREQVCVLCIPPHSPDLALMTIDTYQTSLTVWADVFDEKMKMYMVNTCKFSEQIFIPQLETNITKCRDRGGELPQ